MFEPTVRDGVCQCRSRDARWLVTGWNGAFHDADAVYNVTVPDGFDRTDLRAYGEERRRGAGFDDSGPALLTGVSMTHARCARAGPVTALATVGLSNPAALPTFPDESEAEDGRAASPGESTDEPRWRPGTVNLVVGTDRSLDDGTLTELLATCVEAKAAILTALAGVSGTTSDAAAVGCLPVGEAADFAGSATDVGSAARACVREAVRASFESRYDEQAPPDGVDDAAYGVSTDRRAAVWRP